VDGVGVQRRVVQQLANTALLLERQRP